MKHYYFFLFIALFLWSANVSANGYYTFEDLRALISEPSGELQITDPMVLEGIIISDAGNPNMETNPQTVYNNVDTLENRKTAYIQSLDGKYGLRLKIGNEEDNIFTRYSKVNLNLEGAILVKEENPTRYTLMGITPANIISVTQGTPADVVDKILYINELKDEDIYTYVQLKDVEVSLPYGSWTNINWGYLIKHPEWNPKGTDTPYVDAVPTSIHDNRGGTPICIDKRKGSLVQRKSSYRKWSNQRDSYALLVTPFCRKWFHWELSLKTAFL